MALLQASGNAWQVHAGNGRHGVKTAFTELRGHM